MPVQPTAEQVWSLLFWSVTRVFSDLQQLLRNLYVVFVLCKLYVHMSTLYQTESSCSLSRCCDSNSVSKRVRRVHECVRASLSLSLPPSLSRARLPLCVVFLCSAR